MNILVTGGFGYIGSHVVTKLVNEGHHVYVIDNLSNSRTSVIRNLKMICDDNSFNYLIDDIGSPRSLRYINRIKDRLDAIIHLAGYKSVSESIKNPNSYWVNNVANSLAMYNLASEAGIGIIFSSSACVYGNADRMPVSEETKIGDQQSPYGSTKVANEFILRDYVKFKGLNVVSLRYFNPIGAHESGLIGELPIGVPNNLMPYITQTAAGVREKLTVFGNDYDTPDGTCIRDFIDVNDLANAHVKALTYLIEHKNQYNVFNIGTGRGTSVKELIDKFQAANQVELNWEYGPRRSGDVPVIYADCSKANNELNWKAERSISDSCIESWRWQKYLSEIY